MTLTQPRLSYEHDLIVLQYRYNSLWDFSNVCEIFLNKKTLEQLHLQNKRFRSAAGVGKSVF